MEQQRISELIKSEDFTNPFTGKKLTSVSRIKKMIMDGILSIPDGLLLSTCHDRLVLDTVEFRQECQEKNWVIVYKIVTPGPLENHEDYFYDWFMMRMNFQELRDIGAIAKPGRH